MRIAIAAAVTCLSIVGMTATAQVHAAIREHTEIPAESLDLALRTLAKDRGFQLVYLTENVATLQTHGAVGEFTVDEALKKLLSDSRLEYKFVDDNTVSIFPKTNPTSALGGARTRASDSDENSSRSASKSSQFRLAQVDPGSNPRPISVVGTATDSQSNASESGGLSEIIVTAQKKSERLQDVPVPVSVLNAEQLAGSGQVLLRDYYTSVPGLNVAPSVSGGQLISIRGITTAGFSPTVGVLIDDVPYGPATSAIVPDIDPGDLARIEVLRGPQGTLYGADSLGGLINFVTNDPSTKQFSGRVEAGADAVDNGHQTGYNLRGSVNIPINDELAIRASAFRRQDPGYIDNPTYGLKGVNEGEADGGRLSVLWLPTETMSLKLGALYQELKTSGTSDVVSVVNGNYQQNQFYVPNAGGGAVTSQAYSAVFKAALGAVNLTSVTGYNINRDTVSWQATFYYGPFAKLLYSDIDPGATGGPVYNSELDRKFTEELRLSGSFLEKFDWLAGGYYTHEKDGFTQQALAVNPFTGSSPGGIFADSAPSRFTEYAGFGDLTYHLSDRLQLDVGARESRVIVNPLDLVYSGPLYPGGSITPASESKANVFTYLVTPSFRISGDLMVYVRLASGYRPGGSNSATTVGEGASPQFAADKTNNYEIGVKGDFVDHRVSVDASLYYIDWKDIQLSLTTVEQAGYTGNGGRAKSAGVEMSVTARPFRGTTISAWGSYDDAVLTEDFPSNGSYGKSGDRLPNSARFSGSFSLQQDFPLSNEINGFVSGRVSYIGDRLGAFGLTSTRQDLPGYSKADLRTGITYKAYTFSAYVNNVANGSGLIQGGLGYYPPIAFSRIQPRTVGVDVAVTF